MSREGLSRGAIAPRAANFVRPRFGFWRRLKVDLVKRDVLAVALHACPEEHQITPHLGGFYRIVEHPFSYHKTPSDQRRMSMSGDGGSAGIGDGGSGI